MKPQLPLFIDRLTEGRTEVIQESIDPALLEISDDEINCTEQVIVSGEAYLAEDFLVISLTIKTRCALVCRFCNEVFSYPIAITSKLEEVGLEEIRGACFDLLPLIRELILLELPLYPQCDGASCKNRSRIEPYLTKKDETVHTPFKDLL